MGYRSQEFFSTTKSGYNRLMELVGEESKDVSYPIRSNSFPTYLEFDNGVIFGAEDAQWYGKEIDAFERAFERFDSEGYPWTRIHIGEECGDVEERYSKIAWKTDIPHLYTTTDWSYE